MSMGGAFNLDAKSVLIDKLGEDPKRFRLSNNIFKNGKGLNAVFEIRKLKAELLDFAKDPNISNKDLGPLKPKQPDLTNLSEDDRAVEIQNYKELLSLWELQKKALAMQVPIADMFAIEQYMQPFEDTIDATPAVKGKMFFALTKPIAEEKSGFLGMGKQQQQ